jgi:DNA-directed RNA polymerase subunit F
MVSEEMVTNAEALELLAKRAKETKLEYEQKNTLAHLKKFVKLKASDAKRLVKELEAIPGLKERQRIAIANSLPEDKDDLRMVLHKEYTVFTPEQHEKIIEIVKRFL